MENKRTLFDWLKRIIGCEAERKSGKKSKRWRWFLGTIKFKQHPPLLPQVRAFSEATEEQKIHAMNVAIATAAAAEAAVAAAQAAAEVVRLTGASMSYYKVSLRDRDRAATKIQSAFRGHLARKALRALKGLVRLQAIIRGRAVRRHVMLSSKNLPSDAKLLSKAHDRKTTFRSIICNDASKKELGEMEMKLETKNGRNWDFSLLSKEDMETALLRKQEAAIKRERMMKYSYSHREGRNTYSLEKPAHDKGRIKLRNAQKQDSLDGLNLPFLLPRRSFGHAREDDSLSLSDSPSFPTYMAETRSAKAKVRSLSTPKQRVGFLDTFLDPIVPIKKGVFVWSSCNGEPFSLN